MQIMFLFVNFFVWKYEFRFLLIANIQRFINISRVNYLIVLLQFAFNLSQHFALLSLLNLFRKIKKQTFDHEKYIEIFIIV